MESGPDPSFRSGLAISAEDDACDRDRPAYPPAGFRELARAAATVPPLTSFCRCPVCGCQSPNALRAKIKALKAKFSPDLAKLGGVGVRLANVLKTYPRQDRKGTWPDHPAVVARLCRRSDRIGLMAAYGPKAKKLERPRRSAVAGTPDLPRAVPDRRF